ncbi:MAG: long-chain-fatty-acid--CoA ligase [Planctomycetes bacterium]|nr:long-chain-fatty-acid--CoA ligase [Planctomycetota bacterium]
MTSKKSAPWLNLGQILKVNVRKFSDKIALKDRTRKLTYAELNQRVNKLSHALLSSGLKKGDKISCFLENCIEIVELYLACAKTGIIINPINFRLTAREVAYIAEHADSQAFFVHEEFESLITSIKTDLPKIKNYIVVGEKEIKGYQRYEKLLKGSPDREPDCSVQPEDTWVLLYTSGTTGQPKGVVRSHESYIAFYLINAVDFEFTANDICLNIMPLSHVNSTFFSFIFPYIGGTVYIHPARKFDPVEILEIIDREKATFISLIPTHYSLILNVPAEQKKKHDVQSVKKLLCSSAPARGEIKQRIMEFFKGVQLYEGYGSTEAGIVTVLKPIEQMSKLGSIGRESCGTDCVKLLDDKGRKVPVGEVGEIYSRGPMLFDKYYKLPEKTKSSFQGEWFSAGDLGKKDNDGYYYIVDRKDNMIITGGEHVYPSEVEEVISKHPAVFDVAVIGVPDEKWGEAVQAVIILKDGQKSRPEEIINFCRERMATYKKPKSVDFIKNSAMPRTVSGKILHRELRKKYS